MLNDITYRFLDDEDDHNPHDDNDRVRDDDNNWEDRSQDIPITTK